MGGVYIYQCVFLAQLSILIGTTSFTWSSPILSKLNETDDNPLGRIITSTENSLLASLPPLAASCGAIIFGTLSTYFGRKTLLIAGAFPSLIAYLAMAWAKNIWIFYFGRFLTGFAVGGTYSILPMYNGELADVNNRGILVTSMGVFVNIGKLIPYILGPYISFFWFHIILALLPAIFIPLFFFLAPESPHYLIHKNFAEAEAVLKKLRGRDDVLQIMKDIMDEKENKSKGSMFDILRSKALRNGLLIGLGSYTFMLLTGTGVITSYNQRIFEIANMGIPPEQGPIIVTIAQLIVTIVVSSVADRYPRRLLLIISFAGIALVEIPFGIYFFLQDRAYDVSSISLLPLICLVLYVIFYDVGVGPVLMVFLGELFPDAVKGVAVSFLVFWKWSGTFVLTLLFNTLEETLGMSYLLWISAVACCIATIFIKYVVIETKGKTFGEIQEKLSE